MGQTLVSLENAGARRSKKWLVRNVDLSVSAGEIVTLIGPNGSGKSTTAKLALGISKATEGKVERKKDLRIGYVPQKLLVDWTLPLSVKRLMTLTVTLSDEEIVSALEMVGVASLVNSQVHTLSGGEFQRVLLARALYHDPQVLFLDEGTANLDVETEKQIVQTITAMNITRIIVAHRPAFLENSNVLLTV